MCFSKHDITNVHSEKEKTLVGFIGFSSFFPMISDFPTQTSRYSLFLPKEYEKWSPKKIV